MIDGNMIAGIKAIENNLAHEENRELERVAMMFPEDHPIREEYTKHKSQGDLSTLPPNHPFIAVLKRAKAQLEATDEKEEDEGQAEVDKSQERQERYEKRKAAERQERVKDEEVRAIRRMASTQLNSQIARVNKEVADLYGTMQSVKDDLTDDPYTRSKVIKLERMLVAMKRALEECKISTTRMI